MQNETLADRLVNYSDGLVAAAFVFMGGIGAAIGDPETRCELADAAPKVIATILFSGAAILFALFWLRSWSARLRDGVEISDAAALVSRRLDFVRSILVVLFVFGAIGFVLLSFTDESCPAAGQSLARTLDVERAVCASHAPAPTPS